MILAALAALAPWALPPNSGEDVGELTALLLVLVGEDDARDLVFSLLVKTVEEVLRGKA